ncbi:MAG: type II toxin-antitoxin system HicB family antitoxin [Chloroflexota bacterium]|nr:type II toxin-antitoxin system HicB family antitoxin [Chloroflexota bacterium]
MQYLVIIEGDDATGYGAYVPDLPGCIAAAETREEVEQLIREAVPFHLEGMAEVGDPIPPATSRAITVDVHIPVAA